MAGKLAGGTKTPKSQCLVSGTLRTPVKLGKEERQVGKWSRVFLGRRF